MTRKNQNTTFDVIRQMSKKEKKDVCRDQSTYGPVEGCDVAGMSISDCLKCPLNSIEHDHSHILRPIWRDSMIEIGYFKR
jgi:hypothetical protein